MKKRRLTKKEKEHKAYIKKLREHKLKAKAAMN